MIFLALSSCMKLSLQPNRINRFQ